MKIAAWNINSIRNKVDLVEALLKKYNIDILVITETKIQPKHESSIRNINGYSVIWSSNQKSSYHGTAIFHKSDISILSLTTELENLNKLNMVRVDLKNNKLVSSHLNHIEQDTNLAHKTEGRIISVLCKRENKTFVLVGTYCPNSGCDRKVPLKRLAYRTLRWDKDLYLYLLKLEKEYENVIWVGDLNVTRLDCDMHKKNMNISGTTPEERTNFNLFIDKNNWIDTFDYKNPLKTSIWERFTYGKESSCKLRLDYIMCTPSLKDNIVNSIILQEVDGSDHVPVLAVFNL